MSESSFESDPETLSPTAMEFYQQLHEQMFSGDGPQEEAPAEAPLETVAAMIADLAIGNAPPDPATQSPITDATEVDHDAKQKTAPLGNYQPATVTDEVTDETTVTRQDSNATSIDEVPVGPSQDGRDATNSPHPDNTTRLTDAQAQALSELARLAVNARAKVALREIQDAYLECANRFFDRYVIEDRGFITSESTREDFKSFIQDNGPTAHGETIRLIDFAAAVNMKHHIKTQFDADFTVGKLVSMRIYVHHHGRDVPLMAQRALFFIVQKCTRIGTMSPTDAIDAVFRMCSVIGDGCQGVEMLRPLYYEILPDLTRSIGEAALDKLNVVKTEELVDAMYWCLAAIDPHGAEGFFYDLLVKMGLVDQDETQFADMLLEKTFGL